MATMIQKIINALAILSFGGVAGIVGGGTYVYLQRDAIIDGVKAQVTKAAIEGVSGALPGMMDSAMPELPSATGGAIGMPATTGGVALPF
jgi:hypothetical protein|tara:strand:- start:53 stop:322 length:270 start_codon:yes stop_codon:yes gene_type:complete